MRMRVLFLINLYMEGREVNCGRVGEAGKLCHDAKFSSQSSALAFRSGK